MQMWCRLGQVLAGFWGSHLGTDVVQTNEREFGVGYLGLGVLGVSHLGPDLVQARWGALRSFLGVSFTQRHSSGQGGSLGGNPAEGWEGFTWTQNQCWPEQRFPGRFRSGLTGAQTWCRLQGQFEGVLWRPAGLTCAQTRCSPAAMALAGPSQRNTWHFSTCVKGSRAT